MSYLLSYDAQGFKDVELTCPLIKARELFIVENKLL